MRDETDLKVVPIGGGNLRDIAQCMENMAARVRGEADGKMVAGACVLLNEEGEIVVAGWGDADDVRAVGILILGAEWLSSHRSRR